MGIWDGLIIFGHEFMKSAHEFPKTHMSVKRRMKFEKKAHEICKNAHEYGA